MVLNQNHREDSTRSYDIFRALRVITSSKMLGSVLLQRRRRTARVISYHLTVITHLSQRMMRKLYMTVSERSLRASVENPDI